MRPSSLALAVVLLILSACNGAVDPADDHENYGWAYGTILDEIFNALGGAEICVLDRPELECAVTESNGSYEILLPRHGTIEVTFSKLGYWTRLRPLVMPEFDEVLDAGNVQLFSEEWVLGQEDRVSVFQESSLGMISLLASDALAAVTFEVEGSPGDGPYYFGAGLNLEPELEATSQEGFGFGGVLNVPPGTHRVTASHPDRTCIPHSLLPQEGEVAIVPVAAQSFTLVVFRCEE
jgi:hypothetical protein